MTLSPAGPDFLTAVKAALGAQAISAPGPAYLSEPRGRFHGRAKYLLRPRHTAGVATLVKLANQHRVGLIPFGGGTGLVSGQVQGPEGPPAVLVSLDRMAKLRSVDGTDNLLIAEAGATLADIRTAAAKADRLFPLSLASEGSARIGGCLSTNAGGVQVLRYGNTRDLCVGLEAVLPDGSVLAGPGRLRKDNTGYDLRHLLIGAEGTLGIITATSLRLFPQPRTVSTALATIADPAAALDLLRRLQDRFGDAVTAFELIARQGLTFLQDHNLPVRPPFATPPAWSVLIDITTTPDDLAEALVTVLGNKAEVYLAQTQAQSDAFWTIRETIPEGNRLTGAVSSHDISVPVSRIPDFVTRGTALIAAIDPALRINCFGHMGDGNLHFNVFPPRGGDKADYTQIRDVVMRKVHDLVHDMDGSVSAEHGIGRLKRDELQRYGDPTKLAAMRAIKAALDPNGIMNPGALL
ncbi:FAD-binding oxidoreductase [Halovulum sp. GXIMD14793]